MVWGINSSENMNKHLHWKIHLHNFAFSSSILQLNLCIIRSKTGYSQESKGTFPHHRWKLSYSPLNYNMRFSSEIGHQLNILKMSKKLTHVLLSLWSNHKRQSYASFLHTAFTPFPVPFCSSAEQEALEICSSACWTSISSPHRVGHFAPIRRLTSKQCTGSPLRSVSGACSKCQSLPLLYVMKVFTWSSIFLLAKNIPFIPATWEKSTWLKNTSI